ncbi:MAG: hypothetical protein E7227_04405 [Clostridiales bacterium]|nr:hypothetical protein [Clostridiales bacterium]
MKKSIKEKMIAATLALIMSASPVWGVAFAADEAAEEIPQTVVSEEVAQPAEEKEEAPAVETPVEEVKEEIKEEAPVAETPAAETPAAEAPKMKAASVPEKSETSEPAAATAEKKEETKPAEAAPVKRASSYKVTVKLAGIKNASGAEETATLSYTVSVSGTKTISASTLNAKVKTKSVRVDGVTYKFDNLWRDASGNEVSSITIDGADLWEPTELVYTAVYSAYPDKTVTVNFSGILKPDGTETGSSVSNTLSAGGGWSFLKKKLDNMVTAKSFSLNGDKYVYAEKWEDENGNEFSALSVKYDELDGDTVINIHPVYNITECKKLSFNYIDGVSTGSGSWANKDSFDSYTHTFKQPDDQDHYQFICWEDPEAEITYQAGDKFTIKSADLPEIHNEINIYAKWQPSVTVRYHYNGEVAEVESFEDINVYDKAAEFDGIQYNGWYGEDGSMLAEDAVYEAPEAVNEKVERTVYDVYAKRPVTIKAASATWTYDGKEHSDSSVSVTEGGLFEGDEIVAEVSGSITKVGEAANIIDSVMIMRDGVDVSEYYDITTIEGALNIKAAPAKPEKPETPSTPAAPVKPGTPAAPATPSAPETTYSVSAGTTATTAPAAANNEPEAVSLIENTPAPTADSVNIEDGDTPLAVEQTWALLNLIMTIVTGIISAVLLAGWFGKKEEDDEEENEDENEETRRKGFVRLSSILPAAGAIVAFILTENMNNPMAFTDRWTILMAVILLIQGVVALLAKKESKEEEDEEATEAINA